MLNSFKYNHNNVEALNNSVLAFYYTGLYSIVFQIAVHIKICNCFVAFGNKSVVSSTQGQLCLYSEIQENKLELTLCPGKLMDYRT